jgi:hypothetical protein
VKRTDLSITRVAASAKACTVGGRVGAAKLLGMDQIPAICTEDVSEDQIRGYRVADNKLAELAGWDREILANRCERTSDSHSSSVHESLEHSHERYLIECSQGSRENARGVEGHGYR